MKKIALFLLAVIFLQSCDSTTEKFDHNSEVNLVPIPKQISVSAQAVRLSEQSTIFVEEALAPLAKIFQAELLGLTDFKVEIAESKNSADITFAIDSEQEKDSYQIKIDKEITVTGGSYQALAMARNSLLQLAFVEDGKISFPVLNMEDRPDSGYRGLMIDLARQWHSVESIKELINMSSFYKSNYLHLHFTDYQSYTLPSKKYPKLSTPDRHYTFEELEMLEAYAQERGVTIIPEIDIPGHASSIVEAYPELFGIKDIKENPWTINMGKEEVYTALEEILSEIIPIFKSTPIIHIGGDEAIFHKLDNDPHVQEYMKANNLGDDVHDLYRHFIVRMNDIVKKQGKQMAVWEGFRKEGKVEIPKDIIVYEFETNRYLPNDLIEDGYTVVNTSWKPLYVVNRKKWEPETIYNWNVSRWENWFPKAPSFDPIQTNGSDLILGAQMCAWEQAEQSEFISLRKRLPVMNERIWNVEHQVDFPTFMSRLDATDELLSKLTGNTKQDSLLHGHNYVDDRPDR
ncbi:family 20 glycosylhydrolase [Roseivirga sp.]|uniref:family 20 glycosylhydrolase n=1 Tax=Roseivirga sp. TaxID=1964215 RepID=UPI002B27B734|nr:family 20 glycosylhydrolase [Roseivirga sp.]